MRRSATLLASLLLSASMLRADEATNTFDAATASDEQLVAAAIRYGTTPSKRTDKQAARTTLMKRKGEGLRAVMSFMHADSVSLSVLAQEMVDALPASNAVPVLLEFAASADTNTQKFAVYMLGSYKTPEHAKVIAPFLADEKLRGVTVRTLGKWGVQSYATRISSFLSQTNERLRVTAVIALEDMRATNAIPDLVTALGDPMFTVRNRAQEALVTFGKASERPLLDALPAAGPPAQRLIVRALGDIGSRKAVRPLRRLLVDPDPHLRDDAHQALDAIARSSAGAWL